MTQNKNHWYDGWFYDTIIAPNQDQLFRQIESLIEDQKTIIDVGCGTGRLSFSLADKCKSILGIDLSKRNINRANLRLNQRSDEKISFYHGNVSGLHHNGQPHFDYAMLTYVVHEVNEEERIILLKDISGIAGKIIIGDYVTPKPSGYKGRVSEIIEFIAGREHYRNYRNYMANGGIYYLAKKVGLNIVNEIRDQSSTNHIVVLEGKNQIHLSE